MDTMLVRTLKFAIGTELVLADIFQQTRTVNRAVRWQDSPR
jgi:hypothetical protein